MIIKSFTGETTAAALKRVREEMGGQAIVLKTVQNESASRQARVEVTACLDRPSVGQSSMLLARTTAEDNPTAVSSTDAAIPHDVESADPAVIAERLKELEAQLQQLVSGGQRPAQQQQNPELVKACRQMQHADYPEEFVEQVMASVTSKPMLETDMGAVIHTELTSQLAGLMQPDLDFKPGDRVVFVGPAGAGKSSVMGKIAANLVIRHGMRVTLLTQDSTKPAAADEITCYAAVVGADVVNSLSDENQDKLRRSVLLIDTPALPSDSDRVLQLADRIEATNPTHRVAVFSALTRSTDIPGLVARLEPLGTTHVAMTMLDLTESHGSCVAAALATNCRIGFVTDAPGGVGRAGAPDPDQMARLVLRQESHRE